jgi:hypothetical protein
VVVNSKGKLPALLGDSQSLTVTGVVNSLRSVNRSKCNGKETVQERVSDSKSYEVGMQISRGVYSEVSAQSLVWAIAAVLGRGGAGVSAAERESRRRRAFASRPRTYAAVDSAQICGSAGGGIAEGEECNSHCPDIWRAAAEFCRRTLLGARVLCDDGWP